PQVRHGKNTDFTRIHLKNASDPPAADKRPRVRQYLWRIAIRFKMLIRQKVWRTPLLNRIDASPVNVIDYF
ncbi:MAG: hypothetical protein PVG52_12705, partial [Desulfobacterales bacterium]